MAVRQQHNSRIHAGQQHKNGIIRTAHPTARQIPQGGSVRRFLAYFKYPLKESYTHHAAHDR